MSKVKEFLDSVRTVDGSNPSVARLMHHVRAVGGAFGAEFAAAVEADLTAPTQAEQFHTFMQDAAPTSPELFECAASVIDMLKGESELLKDLTGRIGCHLVGLDPDQKEDLPSAESEVLTTAQRVDAGPSTL